MQIVKHVIQIRNGIMKNFNLVVKIIVHSKQILVRIVAHVYVGKVMI